MKRRVIQKLIDPQLSSEVGGIRWYRSLTPADTQMANPFVALDIFRSTHLKNEVHLSRPRHFQGVSQFSYIFSGRYSVRINQNQILHAKAGNLIGIETGEGSSLEEVFIPEAGKLDGFHLWIRQHIDRKMNVSIQANPENQLTFNQGGVQVQNLWNGNSQINPDSTKSDFQILDVKMPSEAVFDWETRSEKKVLVYIYQGRGYFGPYQENDDKVVNRFHVLLLDQGNTIKVQTRGTPMSFFLAIANPVEGDFIRKGAKLFQVNEI